MEFTTRILTSTNWITILIIGSALLLVAAKIVNTVKFSDFIALISNSKYIVVHQKTNNFSHTFNLLLIGFQFLSISLFLYICYTTFQETIPEQPLILYLKIATAYTMIVICKMLVEKILGVIFSMEHIIDSYIFYKMSYRNLIAVIILPLSIAFTYTISPSQITLIVILIFILVLNSVILFFAYKKNETIILNNLFYFILYLCALEIIPYFILYKLIN